MKRIALYFAASFFLFLLIPQSFIASAVNAATVTSPKAGNAWVIGTKSVITWSGSTASGQLHLYASDSKIGVISSNVNFSTGSFTWTVGALEGGIKVPPAKDYRVWLVQNGGPIAKSDLFAIDKLYYYTELKTNMGTRLFGGALSAIAVNSPAADSKFKPGEWIPLTWNKAGIEGYQTVTLGVYLPDKKTFVGSVGSNANPATSWPNSGSYDAPVFNQRYQVGKQYVLRVATPDEKHIGFSGIFSIIPLTAVPVTEELGPEIYHIDYTTNTKSLFPGCFYSKGTAAPPVPEFTHPIGVHNIMDNSDGAGPCWSATGHLYRAVTTSHQIHKGWEVVKAELQFNITQGTKQTIGVGVRESKSDELNVPITGIATMSSWEFGQQINVDVTKAVQDWCSGSKENYGFVISGQEGNWGAENNEHHIAYVSMPKLVITMIQYK